MAALLLTPSACCKCNSPLLNDAAVCAGLAWHPKCFNCCNCKKSLVGAWCYMKNSSIFCSACYKVEKCMGGNLICMKHLQSHTTRAFQAQALHSCTFDPASIQCGPFTPPHLTLHVSTTGMYFPRCCSCNEPIDDCTGRKALNAKWHEKCLRCSTCLQQLSTCYAVHENKPICIECHKRKIIQSKPDGIA